MVNGIRTAIVALVVATTVAAETDTDPRSPAFEAELDFEVVRDGRLHGWSRTSGLAPDGEVTRSGSTAARLSRTEESRGTYSRFERSLDIDFDGAEITLRGSIRTREVTGAAGIWIRVDGREGTLRIDNMMDRPISGTTEWQEVEARVALDDASMSIAFGGLVVGTGEVWVDDLSLWVDGVLLSSTDVVVPDPTIHELDREFVDGSEVDIADVTAIQIENLARLGRVWGFLKYHHPEVTEGRRHWDFDLFRAFPSVLSATTAKESRAAILTWAMKRLGSPPPCDPCATSDGEAVLPADFRWLEDRDALGDDLHAYLTEVYERRHATGAQHYVSLVRNIRNPDFETELAYDGLETVDAGYRLLALFRYWNIIQYWFPYRDVIGEDWLDVLPEFIPEFVAAADRDAYRLVLHRLIARVNDTHANLWSALDVRPPGGDCRVLAKIRFVEDRPTVVRTNDAVPELELGDVIEAIDGIDVDTFVRDWPPYYSASNEPTRLRDFGRSLTRGVCGPCTLTVRSADGTREVVVERTSREEKGTWTVPSRDTLTWLAEDIAYVTLASITRDTASQIAEEVQPAKAVVIDIRNYPNEFVVFALGQHLVDSVTPFVKFTRGQLHNPGAFEWTNELKISPRSPRITAPVAILVDASSQSQAEYTAMAFRSSPDAIVVGSTTAGADGNASWFDLPGGERSMISGIGVFYPDGTPTQRIGIVPDVEAHPTIAGVREGRDEVLEAALRHLVGNTVDEEAIIRMSEW